MSNQQYVYFNEMPTSTVFHKNGNTYKKQSTRTARIVKPVEYAGNWFYFSMKELCIVGVHDRL